jgi:hypothetical protein
MQTKSYRHTLTVLLIFKITFNFKRYYLFRDNEMKKYLLATAVISALVSASAFAADSNASSSSQGEEKAYAEFGVIALRTEESGFSANNAVGLLRVGYNFDKNFSGEVVAGGGMNDASGYYGSTFVTFKVNSVYGAYLKAKTEVTPDLEIFARLGVLHVDVTATAANAYVSAWANSYDNSVSFGAGAQYNFSKTVYGQADYMSYYNKSGTSSNGPSVSLGYQF